MSMPKVKVSDAKKVRSIINDFKEFTVTPKDELYCPLCCCIVKHEKRFFVEQHVATLKHKKSIEKTNIAGTSDTRQTFINAGKQQDFATKLVQAFASSDIPLVKVKVKCVYNEVDNLIAAVKASVVKNRSRAADFNVCGRPPQPIVTRWGSWLDAANYYAEKLPQVREIVNSWNGEGVIVRKVKNAVNDEKLTSQLTEISQSYSGLTNLILKMESCTYTVQEAYDDINSLDLGSDPLQLRKYIKKRLEKNDVKTIVEQSRPDISPALYAKLLKCQPTSASVERSFSLLKSIVRPNRNFADANIAYYMKLYLNAY